MADILNTGISGLIAFQRMINTTSHNISNSSTPGYSRQRVELEKPSLVQLLVMALLVVVLMLKPSHVLMMSFLTSQLREATNRGAAF